MGVVRNECLVEGVEWGEKKVLEGVLYGGKNGVEGGGVWVRGCEGCRVMIKRVGGKWVFRVRDGWMNGGLKKIRVSYKGERIEVGMGEGEFWGRRVDVWGGDLVGDVVRGVFEGEGLEILEGDRVRVGGG